MSDSIQPIVVPSGPLFPGIFRFFSADRRVKCHRGVPAKLSVVCVLLLQAIDRDKGKKGKKGKGGKKGGKKKGGKKGKKMKDLTPDR